VPSSGSTSSYRSAARSTTASRGCSRSQTTCAELAERFAIVELVYDPWRFGQAAQELERERLVCVQFPQTDQRMIPASSRLHAAITERRITLPDDPELAKHAANAIARHSRRGWRIDKPNSRTHIDAVIALAMALDRLEDQPEPVRLLGWF